MLNLRIFKVYFTEPINDEPDSFLIPAYTAEAAIKYAEEAGIKVEYCHECLFKEGFIIC